MQNNKLLTIIALLLVMALFNLIVFTIPFHKTDVFWISYAFGMFAILFQVVIYRVAWSKATSLKSKFLGIPFIQVGFFYAAAQLTSSAVFMLMSHAPYQVPLIINSILLVTCILALIATEIGRDVVTPIDIKATQKVNFIKSLQFDIEAVANIVEVGETRLALSSLAEIFQFSDPMSDATLAPAEEEIRKLVTELTSAVEQKDWALVNDQIICIERLMKQRNRNVLLRK